MGKGKFEQYEDNQFYQYVHGYVFEDFEYSGGGFEPGFSKWVLKHFGYDDYVTSYRAAQEQQVLLKGQETALSEAEFAKRKKRLVDLCTVHQPSERLVRQQRTLIDTLCLNPYQRYQYRDYVKMYEVAKETDGCPGEAALGKEEFRRFKQELILSLQEKMATRSRIKRERQLRTTLFPGAYIRE